jgi:hypothetical protein
MAKLLFKKEDENTPALEETYSTTKDCEDDEDLFALLEKLETDETRLSEQKEHLSSLFDQLQLKVRGEVENKKCRIQMLNSEIADLKIKCEKYAKWIKHGEMPK